MFFIISFLLLCFCFCLLQPNHFRPDQRGAAENAEARGEKLKTVLRADRARERPRGGFMPPLEKGKSRESDGKQPRGGKALPGYTPRGTLLRCAPATACMTRLHLNLATTLAVNKLASSFKLIKLWNTYYSARYF